MQAAHKYVADAVNHKSLSPEYYSLRECSVHGHLKMCLSKLWVTCRYDQRSEARSVSNRRRVEWVRDIEAGDEFDFVLHPRGTHSCDGMSVIDIIIWPAAASAA